MRDERGAGVTCAAHGTQDSQGVHEGRQEQGQRGLHDKVAGERPQQPRRELAAGKLQCHHRQRKRQGGDRDQRTGNRIQQRPGRARITAEQQVVKPARQTAIDVGIESGKDDACNQSGEHAERR
jgi:hypothetical protein